MTSADPSAAILSVIDRLNDAMNRRDIDAFVDCYDADYKVSQPCHPERTFTGSDRVRKNWTKIFENIPDFTSELVRASVFGEAVFCEWHWFGTAIDDALFDMRGVTIFGVAADRLAWGCLYMEMVDEDDPGIDASISRLTGGPRR